jgi:hypothetical protein
LPRRISTGSQPGAHRRAGARPYDRGFEAGDGRQEDRVRRIVTATVLVAALTAPIPAAAVGRAPSTRPHREQREIVAVPTDLRLGLRAREPEAFDVLFDHGRLEVFARAQPSLVVVSSRVTRSERSVRCGYGPGREREGFRKGGLRVERGTDVTVTSSASFGPTARYAVNVVTVNAPPVVNEDVAPLIARASMVLSPEQLRPMVADPERVFTRGRWHHAFDGGPEVRGRFRGSLRGGFTYRLDAQGLGGIAQVGGVIRCHRTIGPLAGDGETLFPFAVPWGEHLEVDGRRVRDVADDPALQASWALVRVGRGEPPARVTFVGRAGRRIDSTRVAYIPPARLR